MLLTILWLFFLYLILSSIYKTFTTKNYIVIGTISNSTVEEQQRLSALGYKILHADQLRNLGINYEKASKKIFLKFILKSLAFKKVALFTSDPRFLEPEWKMLLNVFINVRTADSRVQRSKNLEWLKNLSPGEALEYLPAYFSKNIVCKYEKAKMRVDILTEELERYSDDRFLPEIIWEGSMGGILQHD